MKRNLISSSKSHQILKLTIVILQLSGRYTILSNMENGVFGKKRVSLISPCSTVGSIVSCGWNVNGRKSGGGLGGRIIVGEEGNLYIRTCARLV